MASALQHGVHSTQPNAQALNLPAAARSRQLLRCQAGTSTCSCSTSYLNSSTRSALSSRCVKPSAGHGTLCTIPPVSLHDLSRSQAQFLVPAHQRHNLPHTLLQLVKSSIMCRQSSVMCGVSLHGAFMPLGSRRSHAQRRASHIVRADVNYYNVLGVDKDADKKSIKQAYRCAPQRVQTHFFARLSGNPVQTSPGPQLAVAAVCKDCGRQTCLHAYRHDMQAMLLQAEGAQIPSRCK